ncbi:MAG TPA: NAD(P)-dependent oxidoreductase, partial [Cryptosporangiaceae bacterium]|nr:NAD(P)-dependent oxidoreductase [Cryptosporangiaceae bacterium]
FHRHGTDDLADDLPPAPDTYYGFSKAAMESLGALYHHRFGLHVVCLRIGTCADRPDYARALWSWLSPDDCARLVEASLTAEGYHLVWGVSANSRRWWSPQGGDRIGYTPQDDAERYAAEFDEPELSPDTTVGGQFCTAPLGEWMG